MPSLPAYHQQPHDRGTAGFEVEPIPDKKDIRRRVTATEPVTSVYWVTLKNDPGYAHLVNHAVFDGLLQLKYVTWCGRAQHAVRLEPSGGDWPRIPAWQQCPVCVTKVQRFVDHADYALKGR